MVATPSRTANDTSAGTDYLCGKKDYAGQRTPNKIECTFSRYRIIPIYIVHNCREDRKGITTADQIDEDQAKKEAPGKNRHCSSMVEDKHNRRNTQAEDYMNNFSRQFLHHEY